MKFAPHCAMLFRLASEFLRLTDINSGGSPARTSYPREAVVLDKLRKIVKQ